MGTPRVNENIGTRGVFCMAQLVKVRALHAFEYQGKTIASGKHVEMPAVEAAARARKGEVSLDRTYNAQAVEPDPEPEIEIPKPRRRRGAYRRRDMTAEP